MMKTMTPEASFNLGYDVGSLVAESMSIELVGLVVMDLVEALPEDERPRMFPDEIPDYADACQFAAGYTQGMQHRCGAIVTRLNGDRQSRLGTTT